MFHNNFFNLYITVLRYKLFFLRSICYHCPILLFMIFVVVMTLNSLTRFELYDPRPLIVYWSLGPQTNNLKFK